MKTVFPVKSLLVNVVLKVKTLLNYYVMFALLSTNQKNQMKMNKDILNIIYFYYDLFARWKFLLAIENHPYERARMNLFAQLRHQENILSIRSREDKDEYDSDQMYNE